MVNSPVNQQVKSRLVLNFPGFEPTDSAAQLGRLLHVGNSSGTVWGFKVHQKDPIFDPAAHHTVADHESAGANWQVETQVIQYRWNDIVTAYEEAPFPMGFLRDSLKYLAFFLDGAIIGYLKTSPRYWGFTIYPILLVAIFAFFSWYVASFVVSSSLALIATVIFSTFALCKVLGKSTYLLMTIADWGFARDMINKSNPDIESRFAEFTQTTRVQIEQSNQDEIIIVGHSFGAIWAIVALARALEANPDLLKNKKVTFLALGSSILKLALSPKAKTIVDYWNRILAEENVFWQEIQTKDDIIAFYKCDPFELQQFDKPKGGYQIDRVKFKDGMEKARYNKMRRSFYTTHRQYILYNDKRVHFDYALRLFGPFFASELAQDKELHKSIDPDGRLV